MPAVFKVQFGVVLTSQTLLTFPFQRMESEPVTFRSTELAPELFTRVASTRGGRLPNVSPPNPAPPIAPA